MTKLCTTCRKAIEPDRVLRAKTALCADCDSERSCQWRRDNYFSYICRKARERATIKGLPCDITPEYLASIWTGVCPIFGYQLEQTAPRVRAGTRYTIPPNRSALDRVDSDGGYTRGNVAFLSHQANRLKQNATAEQLRKIADWMDDFARSQ